MKLTFHCRFGKKELWHVHRNYLSNSWVQDCEYQRREWARGECAGLGSLVIEGGFIRDGLRTHSDHMWKLQRFYFPSGKVDSWGEKFEKKNVTVRELFQRLEMWRLEDLGHSSRTATKGCQGNRMGGAKSQLKDWSSCPGRREKSDNLGEQKSMNRRPQEQSKIEAGLKLAKGWRLVRK